MCLSRWDFEIPCALWQEAVDALVELVGLKDEGRFLHALELEDYELVDFELFLVFRKEGRVELILEFSIRSEQRRKFFINLSHVLVIDLH